MQINIYKDPMQKAYLFGTAVLYSEKPIPREDVPQHWSSYELRGTVQRPDTPYALEDQASYNFAGSILSPLPLKADSAKSRLVKGKFELTSEYIQLAEFCSEYQISQPQTPIRHMFRPASSTESGFFYALPPEKDEELGAIGHVRIDFGYKGREFWHTWWPRGPEELNTPEFKEELGKVVNDLRLGVLKDLPSMRRYCWGLENGAITGGTCCQNYGFTLETDRYIYRLRCNPTEGDYQAYLGCFDKQAQKQEMGLTEKGRQMLRDAADPSLPHQYSWYVIQDINSADQRVDQVLPLDEAIEHYKGLGSDDKRLGVTKDDIATVDLVIRKDGREWIPEDYRKLDSFARDPVVAEAVGQIRQAMEEQTQGQAMTMGEMM